MSNRPIFVDADPATILSEILADLDSLTGRTIVNGQPEYAIASALAYREVLLKNRINSAGSSLLIDFASGIVLDYLAALFNITRLNAQNATCILQFNIVPGHSQIVLPLGTRVQSSDGTVFFTTDDDIVIGSDVNTITITATCNESGKIGNGYLAGAITDILDPYAYVSSVTNLDTTSGGSSSESDDELRSRVKLATSIFSVAGSENAYIYWTKTTNPLISDVAILTFNDFMPISNYSDFELGHDYYYGDIVLKDGILAACIISSIGVDPVLDNEKWIKPGDVYIYSLLENGEIPNSGMNNKILNTLNSETIRPITDNVVVHSPNEKNYSLILDIIKNPDTIGSALTSTLYDILTNFGSLKSQKLGMDIVATEIESLCRIDGVYDGTITIVPDGPTLNGRNLIVNKLDVAKLQGITINIVGSNNG